jgi:hypothetical protein
LWHVDPFIGNYRETNNEITAIYMQQLRKYAAVLEPLLGIGLPATIEILLETVFLMGPL